MQKRNFNVGYGLHVIEYPNGGFGFVGSVPAQLAYVSKEGESISNELIEKQMRLPASYRSIKTRSWNTKQDAIEAAKQLGFEVLT